MDITAMIKFFDSVGMSYYYNGKRLYYVDYNNKPCKMSKYHLQRK